MIYMKIILALLLAVGVNHNSNHIDNGYNMISNVSGIIISCPRCGHKLDRDKLCNNEDCNAYGYDK